MLAERRHWQHYLVYSAISENPVFAVDEVRKLFDLFQVFAGKEMFFVLRPLQVVEALRLGGSKLSEMPFKVQLFESMAQDYPNGVGFNEFVVYITAFVAGDSKESPGLGAKLASLLSKFQSNKDSQAQLEDFCKEFGCQDLKPQLERLLSGSK